MADGQLNILQIVADSQSGQLLFYDGEAAYLPEIQYSADGKLNWESTFNPLKHAYQYNNTVEVEGHKYLRIRKNPTEEWGIPAKFIGEDGEPCELSVYDNILIQKKADGIEIKLIDFSLLKGEKGDKGEDSYQIKLNKAMFYDEMIAYNPTSQTATTGCQPCGTGTVSSSTCGLPTVLVLGDNRLHTIEAADYVGTQYHRVDADSEWVLTTGLDLNVTKVRYYGYDGTDPTTIQDATLENTLGNSGKVYVYTDGMWVEVGSISAPDYRMAPNLATKTVGKYAEDYVVFSNTLELTGAGIYEVSDESIAARHILNGTFTHGFNEGDGTIPIKVLPSDFAGFGLSTYTSDTTGEQMLQVNLGALAGDGIEVLATTSTDGETAQIIQVKAEDLVNAANNGGIITAIGPDGELDLVLQALDPLYLEADNLVIKADEKTITTSLPATPNAILQVLESDNLELGIQGKHIHINAYDITRGISKDDSIKKAYLLVDAEQFGFNGVGELYILPDSIHGTQLNDDTANEEHGIKVIDDKLNVLVDGTSIDFNGLGQLTIATNIWDNIPEDKLVKAFQLGNQDNINASLLKDFVKLVLAKDDTGIIDTEITVSTATDTATAKFLINENALDNWIANKGYLKGEAGQIFWEDLEKSSTNSITIEDSFVPYNTDIGPAGQQFRVDKIHGILFKDAAGEYRRLYIGANGFVESSDPIILT